MSRDPRVATAVGDFVGTESRGVRRFLGVPYAEPPTGARRWCRAEPLRRHLGERPARHFGPAAPQLGGGATALDRVFQLVRGPVSEYCHHLNIWSPAGAPSSARSRPVLVWLHGGGFLVGAGSTFVYDGGELARRGDTVVVTVNYRLGALGFLDLRAIDPAARATANLGLHDQRAALAWVGEHIAAFGGDPDRVTLFGESAGAMSVGALLPAGGDLFRRAILQGGAAANVSSSGWAAEIASRFLAHAGVAAGDRGALEALSTAEILAAQRRTTVDAARLRPLRLPWQPSIDGDLIAEPPLDRLRRDGAAAEAVVVGTNRDEWRIATGFDPTLRWSGRAALVRRVGAQLALSPAWAERLVRGYEEILGTDGASPAAVWTAVRTDEIFTLPAVELCDALAAAATAVHAYRFDLPVPLLARRLGACHGAELPFVFGTYGHPLLRPLYGSGEAVERNARRVQDAWLAFARDGSRGLTKLAPPWPRYRSAARSTRVIAETSRVVDDPWRWRLELWRGVDRRAGADTLVG